MKNRKMLTILIAVLILNISGHCFEDMRDVMQWVWTIVFALGLLVEIYGGNKPNRKSLK